MYDILQLNDMLVPELLDVAEQLKIPQAKKLNKQDLIYRILDNQAVSASEKKADPDDKPKRKRISKNESAPDMATPATEVQKEILPKKEITKKREGIIDALSNSL